MPYQSDLTGPTSRFFTSQRLRLHYVEWGPQDAPPLVLVHGGRDHCRNWDWVATDLAKDYRIVAPDLRGHGDSAWLIGGGYRMTDYVYDLAQLFFHLNLEHAPIIGHSLGGAITLQFAGAFPDMVERLIAIEGLGLSPERLERDAKVSTQEKMQKWISDTRSAAGRIPKRYASIEEAAARMHEANSHLSQEQAWHLTVHGVNQNEDGTYSWKFDNYVRINRPFGLTPEETRDFWREIKCPVLLIRGKESWASDPLKDGRAAYFKNARVENFERAGHWVHHDRLDAFLPMARDFLLGK
ncbi:MAG: alpha/beta fold hydrolase [Alphaproteobacteria bacterium]